MSQGPDGTVDFTHPAAPSAAFYPPGSGHLPDTAAVCGAADNVAASAGGADPGGYRPDRYLIVVLIDNPRFCAAM